MYSMQRKIFRILVYPFGFLYAILRTTNSCSRDIINRIFYYKANIKSNVIITDDSIIGRDTLIENNCIINHCKIGKYTMIHMNSRLENVVIGNYCSIAHNVMIGLGEHPIDNFSTSSYFYDSKKTVLENGFHRFKTINIGHDVWIGAGAIVLNGINIGNGSIIAAGSVVTKDIPDYAIVIGVPAKVFKYRNIDKLKIENEWWQLDFKEIILSRKNK